MVMLLAIAAHATSGRPSENFDVQPPSIQRTVAAGSTAEFTNTLVLTNAGDAAVSGFIQESTPGCPGFVDAPWLSLSSVSFSVPPHANQTVTLTLDATGLGEGPHLAILCVVTADVTSVPVELDVISATPDPYNRLANGQFDTDINAWTIRIESPQSGAYWIGNDGTPIAGSMKLENGGACDCVASAKTCAAIDPHRPYVFTYAIKGDQYGLGGVADFATQVDWYADAECTTAIGGPYSDDGQPDLGVWTTHAAGPLLAPDGAHSVSVEFIINNTTALPAAALYDDVQFIDDGIFAAGFEQAVALSPP